MLKNKLSALLLCLTLLFSCGVTANAESTYTVAEVEGFCDGIVVFKENQCGASSVQGLIDTGMRGSAGATAEFYIMGLSQWGYYDFSSYESALKSYLNTHEVYSASSREKYALALIASGSTDRYITDTADEAIGELGLMSLVFGLHILNNGYDSAIYSADGLISDILSWQLSDGGWAVMGSRGDADVTAMTIQSLAPYYGRRGDVTDAVDRGISLLSSMQQSNGGYKSMGAENCESAAQVLTALSDLGIDAQRDSRFIKNGNSVLDAMLCYRNSDGSFTHTGGGFNESATMQAFYAMVAYTRMGYGKSPLYVFDRANHSAPSGDNNGGGGGGNNNGSNGNSGSDSGGSGGGSASGNSGGSSRGSGSSSSGSSDTGQQRIIYINGRPYIEATTASGELMTISVDEEPTQHTDNAPAVRPTYGGFQPSATADTATADESGGGGGYKVYAILCVLLLAGIACLVLYLLKKRNKKNYIAVAILAALAILFLLLTNFQSTDSYRESAVKKGDLTVTMTIRCDTIADEEKVNDYVPDDGVILEEKEFSVSEGDTVYDVLIEAAKWDELHVDHRGSNESAYIAGINHLYEFDYGDLSGWMYRVNGEFPDVGCGSYTLSDGDKIEWLYTMNIGKDLE